MKTNTVIQFPTERTRGPAALALALRQAQAVMSGETQADDGEMARIRDALTANIAWREAVQTETRAELLRKRTEEIEAQTVRHTGAKFAEVKDLDAAEVCKRIRADIKAAVKAGTLPAATYSVRLSRYAGGRSITVRASGFAFDVRVAEPDRDARLPKAWLSRQAYGVELALEAIVNAYVKSEHSSQTDYYACNFHPHVEVSA